MPEQQPYRPPEALSTDTVTSWMFDAEDMRRDFTWQQLESLSRRTTEEASNKRAQAEALLLQAEALQIEAATLDGRAEQLHEASQRSLEEGTNPRHLS